jgi:hypothetical protein
MKRAQELKKQVAMTLYQKKATGQRSKLSCVPSTDGAHLYFIGVIDILQEWNASKQMERYGERKEDEKEGAKRREGDGNGSHRSYFSLKLV